jgi:choline-sulfatase
MAITRRELLVRGSARLAMAAAIRGRAQDRKPNLLFLMADDHARYVLHSEGNALAVTPHLDRLAAEGVRFGRHYCNAPVCTPSRQSILTGQMPHAAGVTVLGTPLAEGKPTLAKQLDAAGYSTAVFGKMHFNRPGEPGLHGFETCVTEDVAEKRWMAAGGVKAVPEVIRTKPSWHPFRDPVRVWLNADKLPFPRYYENMKSTWVVEQAKSFLREHADSPFALWVSLQEPHSPFDFPIEDRAAFDPARFQAPRAGPEDASQIPLIFRGLTDGDKQGIIASYYTSVRYLDHNMGVVLEELRRLNLERDTLVVYMADHGYCLGQHGRFEKHCCYEPAIVAPLIMRWTGRIEPRVVREFTESVDVPPTILEMLGAEPFPVQHGQSLRPYLEQGRMQTPRRAIFSEYLENEEACIRTDKWKFIQCSGKRARTDGYSTENPTPGRYTRLYDLAADPGEFSDRSARHPEVVAALSGMMLERFRATHPEAANEPEHRMVAEAIDWYLRPRDAAPSA